jgi:site-specific DNA recombinase
MRNAVAIYARISQDRSGEGFGVQRQLKDCRAEAERRGWLVAEEYIDDDISAYSGKVRPAYRRMLDHIRDQERDAVIVWHLDRLHRRPIELEEFVQVCAVGGITDVVTLYGDVNLASGDGLLMARLLSAVAASESDAKSRRTRRKMQELAERGLPHSGGVRPFGFAADRMTHNQAEADVIRQVVARFVAGESVASLVRWLDESDIRTVTGKPWRSPTVRNILKSPRNAGLCEHRGQVVGPAAWEPIITREQHAKALAILEDPTRRTNRAARRYLLSGLLRCGLCETKMWSMSRHEYDTRRYLCRSGPDFGGCGKVTVTAPPLEQLISEAVLMRLDSSDLAAALAGRHHDDETSAALSEDIASDEAQLQELSGLWAAKDITTSEWSVARKHIESRLQANRRRQSALTGTTVLDGHIGNATALRSQWASLNLNRQRAIVKAVLDHAIIHPATQRGRRSLDPSRVEPRWRL